ncbi:MAG: hypothetical protein WD025_01050 [Bacteriovoracaceae bacterium]
MTIKDEFTHILKESLELAKKTPNSLAKEEVIDGCGAIIKTASHDYGYDLRLMEQKGLLPSKHPVLLAHQLEAESGALDVEKLELIQQIKGLFRFSFFQLVKTSEIPDSFETLSLESLITWPKKIGSKLALENLLAANPLHFLPNKLQQQTLDSLAIKLDHEISLYFSSKRIQATSPSNSQTRFCHSYLSFMEHVVLNGGYGRLAAIEELLKKECPANWKIRGSYLFLPFVSVSKADFHHAGLLIADENFVSEKIVVNIPLSAFDWQIEDILKKLKTLSKR